MARSYIYTNKKQSVPGIMSSVFGLMSLVTFVLVIYKSYQVAGVGIDRYGTSAFLAIIFMIVGYGLCIYSFFEGDRFLLFRVIGIVLNTMALLCLSFILYAGALVGY